MKKAIRGIISLLFIVAIVSIVGYGYLQGAKPQPVILQGQMEAKEIDIASKISGRIDEIYVTEGEHVDINTPILRMDSPEIKAKVSQAEAARDAADAIATKAEVGARKQEIQMAYEQMQRAKAGYDVAQKTWQRVNTLAKEGLLSRQKADETKAQYLSAQKQYNTASAQYDMAQEGARTEDVAAANAQARQGQAVVEEAMVAESEIELKSSAVGEVAEIIPEAGEIIAKGVPIVTVVNLREQRLELNVREDYLKYFALKNTFTGIVPALNDKKVEFRVYASAVLPDFATWRPTRSDEGFDMRTFLVKSRPVELIDNIRPGMSVLVQLPDEAK